MYEIMLGINNYANVSVYSDIDNIIDLFKSNMNKVVKTIPITDVSIRLVKDYEIDNKNSMFILLGKEKCIKYDIVSNVAVVNINSEEVRLLDMVYVLLLMFCKALNDDNKYLVHSSALKYDNNKSIVLIGDANAGKSSLAYNLMEKYGMQLISNDHTVIGIHDSLLHTFGGTKIMDLRYGAIMEYFPHLSKYIDINNCSDLWGKKMIVSDYISDSLISKDDNTIVTDVFQISLSRGGNAFVKTKDYIDQRLYLYEQLSRQLKGTYNLIPEFDYPMPSIETDEMLDKLNKNIVLALNNTNVHMCQGPLDELSKKMVKKIEKR